MQTVYYLILVPMVYVAFAVFFVGVAVRIAQIARTPKNPATLQIFPDKGASWLRSVGDTFLLPTVRRHNPVLWVFLMLYHIAFLLLIIGHIELFGDINWFQFISHDPFLGQGIVGLTLSICLLYFLFRRFFSPNRDLSVPEDYFLLILLFLTVIFGSELDWARRWYDYSELGVADYSDYLMSLLRFQPELPDAMTASGHSFMIALHVFFANLFLIFLPFSKIMHSFFALPMNKLRRG